MKKLNINKINFQNGFLALFSVIIISFILVLISSTLSYFGFSTRFNILDSESKIKSKILAESCLESARLALALDNNYLVDDMVININNYNCIYSIQNTVPYPTIISHSTVNNSHTFLKATVDINTPSILVVSFKEIPFSQN